MQPTSASLLGRLSASNDAADWQRMVDLYSPLIRGWLHRHSVPKQDGEDVLQEVLTVVARRMPEFRHNQRVGAFRTWLRTITVNCVRDFWKSNRLRAQAPGGSNFGDYLDQLADPDNPLTQAWNREHDLFVTRRLLDMLKPQFEPSTWAAFQRVAIDGVSASEAAAELGITTNAVFIAKSRVLSKLREEADGLIDSE
jgi:RNA polymerase sigma-70 factor (ECF subfamily)